jgi:nitrate/nitrite-specific signal transduction histidine kinase
MVYGTDLTIRYHFNRNLNGNTIERATSTPEHLNILRSGLSGDAAGYYDIVDGDGNTRSQYVYCVPVEGTDMIVSAGTFIDEFSSPAADTESRINSYINTITDYLDNQMSLAQWTFIAIITCMVVIIVLMVSFLSSTITRSIRALANGSAIIAEGHLDHKIELDTGDEIQQLAEQFNTMALALKESYSNLEQKIDDRTRQERQRAEQLRTINEISRRISSIIELDELLPFVVNILRETFGYYNVNIFLVDPQSGMLALKALCISGYEAVINAEVALEMGMESIIGWVAQSGEPMLVNDVSREPKYYSVEELSAIQAELAVPVKIGGKIVGVLDIESDKVNAFDEADLFTAQTLADQLSIAIENARLYKETSKIAVMEERNRLAGEIHDTLAQGFSGIILQLEAAEQAFNENATEEVSRHLNRARSLARGSLKEARRSVWNLQPLALEHMSLPDALNQEVDKFAKFSGVKARFEVVGEKQNLPGEVNTAILRICQESLANVGKHADAKEVKVMLNFEPTIVSLIVIDNGIGFEPGALGVISKKHGGYGLISMQERVNKLGGSFEIRSEEGQGTEVIASIPMRKEEVY